MSDDTLGDEEYSRHVRQRLIPYVLCLAGLLVVSPAATSAQPAPTFGQEGKDVEWVPTPDELVATMLEMAQVTPADIVVDLGSGDGKTVIAAARLGARAVGVEYESNLVEYARRQTAEAGVADLATFVAGDLFDFDLSPATVITMFLLPDLNLRLRPVLFDLTPGTRIVSNTWDLSGTEDDLDAPGWVPDQTIVIDPCPTWCTAHMWTVPAKVGGRWQFDGGELVLEQEWQQVTGELRAGGAAVEIREAQLSGPVLTFLVNDVRYRLRVLAGELRGVARERGNPGEARSWQATRVR